MAVEHNYTLEQLEEMMAQRKESERKEKERARKKYESDRDFMVEELMNEAEELHLALDRFKQKCHVLMTQQGEKLNEYGEMRGNSKGGFSITHTDGNTRVSRIRKTQPFWDERSKKAEELIHQFLEDTVKKRDLDLFEILMGFLQKNENGNLEYDRVMTLLKYETKFTDSRWVEGLRLIKESYRINLRGFGYEFKKKDHNGKWKNLDLSFSSM